ncbi:MAG: hypothetical protein HYZ15_09005 [Sphingobacteriales bacterium]|nr:hypothetical protein [Sphingobacteriales bacterium]
MERIYLYFSDQGAGIQLQRLNSIAVFSSAAGFRCNGVMGNFRGTTRYFRLSAVKTNNLLNEAQLPTYPHLFGMMFGLP